MSTPSTLQSVDSGEIKDRIARFHMVQEGIIGQIHNVIVGQEEVIDQVLIGLFVGGHCLLEGVPGLGKTMLIRTLAQTLDLQFSRIQFTPDLMPSDILGTNMVVDAITDLGRM